MKYIISILLIIQALLTSADSWAAPAGQLDPSFGNGGIRTIGFDLPGGNKNDDGMAMAKAPDGRIYLVGSVNTGTAQSSIGITRLSPDGLIDLAFGGKGTGRAAYAHPNFKGVDVQDAAFQSNGQLVVVGSAWETADSNSGMVACRFQLDGNIDTTFGDPATAGCRLINISQGDIAHAIAIQANNRIVMVGKSLVDGIERSSLVRLTTSGALDTSFDFDGVSQPLPWLQGDHVLRDIALAPNGDLVVAGWVSEGQAANIGFLVARFEAVNGSLDLSFNGSGLRIVQFDVVGTSKRDVAHALTVQSDGSILLAGEVATSAFANRVAVAKLDKDGKPAAGWNFNGKRIYDPCTMMANGCSMIANDIIAMPDGKIVVGGSFNKGNASKDDTFAMRLLPTSVEDASFGSQQPGEKGLSVVLLSNDGGVAYRMAGQGHRVVLAGRARPVPGNGADFAIARLDHGIAVNVAVTPVVEGSGTISPNAQQLVPNSSHVSFTVTPAANHAVKSVSGCGGSLVGNVFTTAPVTQSCQVTAVFAKDVTLTYLPGDNGSIQGKSVQTIPYNTDGQAVEAIPNEGYLFDKWSDFVDINPRTDFNVIGNITVTAQYVPQVWKLLGLPTNAGGIAFPVPGKQVAHGGVDHIIIQPDKGFGVADVVGCNGTLVGNAYVVGPMTDHCYFDVTFEASDAAYDLNYDAGLHCQINGTPKQSVKSGYDGDEVVVTSDNGYVFLQWSDGDKNPVRKDTHVFNHISVTAQCAAIDAQLYTVTPKPGLGGALSPFVPQLVAENDSAQFKVLPSLGHGIKVVSGCSGELSGSVFITAPVTESCEVTAVFAPSNVLYSLDYANGQGGQLVGDLNQQVISGGSGEAVTAVPNPGRYFVQWSDGSTDNPRTDTNVIANVNVTAQFAADGTFMVTPVAGVGGAISPDLIQVVDPGNVVKFTVTPKLGFGIVSVSGCNGTLVGKNYTTGPIDANCEVKAYFAPSDATYLLKYAAGLNGSILGESEQAVPSGGTGKAVTAMPADGYLFLQWSDGSTQNPRIDEGVIDDVDVIAEFVLPESLVVTPVVVGGIGGSFDPALAQIVDENDVVQFTLNPEPGFSVGPVMGCDGELVGNVYTTGPIDASCTVEASFFPTDDVFTLTYTAGPNGKVNGQAVVVQPNIISGGSGLPVQAQAGIGFFFVQWSDGSTENPRVDTNIVANVDVTAQFALNGSLVVTPVVDGPGGSMDPGIAQVVKAGDIVKFTLNPEPGFAIDQISGCPGTLQNKVFTTLPVFASCSVLVSFKPSDEMFLLTYLSGPNGAIQGNAAQVIQAGGTGDAVTAVPVDGFFFVKWSDFPVWLEAERADSNVIGDLTVTATFALNGTPTHIVTATAGAGGAIDPDGEQLAVDGEQLVFTIQPSLGFIIDDVVGCDGSLVGNQYLTAPVKDDCDVVVTFAPANGKQFSLTYTADPGGQVNGQAVVNMTVPAGGDGPAVQATPQAGQFFIQWSDGIGANPRTDTHVAADIDVVAQFAPNGTVIHTVTPSSSLGGALSPLLPQKIADGKTAQFDVLPNEGFAIVSVGGSCGGSLIGNIYTTAPVVDDCTVEAIFAPSDEVFTLTYTAGANGLVNGGQTVQQNVLAGGAGPSVDAQPAAGFVFVQWSDGKTDNPRQDANVAGDIAVTADFAPIGEPTFMVTPVVVGGVGGGLAPPVAQEIAEGESAQFTIVPDNGFVIASVAGTCGGTLNGEVYTTNPVVADCTVAATFEAVETFSLTYTAGANGSLSVGNQPMEAFQEDIVSGGDGSSVTAVPDAGFLFMQWNDGSTANPRTDSDVIADIDVIAQFVAVVPPNHTVTPSVAGAGGTLTPEVPQVVAEGGTTQFTVSANANHALSEVSGTCGGTLVGNVYTTNPVLADCTVIATFEFVGEMVNLTYTAGDNGTLSVGNQPMDVFEESIVSGETGSTVTAVPDAGFYFAQWSDGSTDNPRVDANVVADIDVTAQFVINGSVIVTPIAGEGGNLSPSVPQIVPIGSKLIFTVQPEAGFGVLGVSGCNGMLIGNLYVVSPVEVSCSVEATFAPSNANYSLTYKAGPNGSIPANANQLVASGGNGLFVSAMPVNGHFFVQWSDGSTANPRQDTHVVGDIDVTASFAVNGTPVYTVTPSFGAGGALSPPVPQKVAEGAVAQFTVLPKPGHVVEVSGCDGMLVGNTYVTGPVTANCTVEAVFTPSDQTFTLTYLAGTGGELNGLAEQDVIAGGDGSPVEADPDAGHFFVQWSDGSTQNPRVDTHVVGDMEVTAQFAPNGTPVFTVTPEFGPGGVLSPMVPQQVAQNGVAQFEIVPNEGFGILDVSGCAGSPVGNLYTTGPVTGNCTVKATFAPSEDLLLLTYTAGENGTLQVGNTQQDIVEDVVLTGGTGPVVTAVPDAGFVFVQWSDGSTANPRTDSNVVADIDVVAEFTEVETPIYTVTPSVVGAGGTLTPGGSQDVAEGGTAQFTASPSPGYILGEVTGTCGGTLVGNVFTTDPVTADCTVIATFEVNDRIFANDFEVPQP